LISNPYATEIELDLALERSGLYYEISNDILDLNSLVGENGQNLSGGQRQRLSLAMVLIKSPKVLILDEPTSALDETADQAIWKIISGLSKEITVVVITHRLANVNESYNIIKLDFELNKN
jgi:ABC-type multidrug transport system fused ATPase/permease subunit